ncbi:hypothetical protein D6774_00395 [Candidatus Woesearchaeota archaeon]|nr:MAG: hypothetical protein D6774_00395 [Candidatus Woesearchaeota archaeon]
MSKRWIFPVVIVFFLLVLLQTTSAQGTQEEPTQCCISAFGCQVPFFGGQCDPGYTASPIPCDEQPICDEGVCCQDQNPDARSTYRTVCNAFGPDIEFFKLSDFSGLPVDRFSDQADSICGQFTGIPECQATTCESPNNPAGDLCRCGFTILNASEAPYCCAEDNAVFASQGACALSSCAATAFSTLTGFVYEQGAQDELIPLAGVTVSAGGKKAQTTSTGRYIIDLLPQGAQLTIIATLGSRINSTTITLTQAEQTAPDIILPPALGATQEAECNDGQDNDGDGAIDQCDSDCGTVSASVRESEKQESEEGAYCTDFIDNDCDGLVDEQEPSCQGPQTTCGDFVIQFPNSEGLFEQCDAQYDELGNKINGTDNVCPGRCAPPGTPQQCTCEYQPECGNGIIDEETEECDGVWDPVNKLFKPSTYKGPVPQTQCGVPGSANECKVIGLQRCGDGIVQYPQELCEINQTTGDIISAPGFSCLPGTCNNCNCDLGPVCGNGFVEAGEDCDGIWDISTQSWDPETFVTNKFGATPQNCAPPNRELQQGYNPYKTQGPFQTSQCNAPDSCENSPGGPTNLNVSAVQFEKIMRVTWQDTCLREKPEVIDKYIVYRCNAEPGGACEPTTPIATLPREETTFDDTQVQPNQRYCWAVKGIYNKPNANNQQPQSLTTTDGSIVCKTVGDRECINLKSRYPLIPNVKEFCAGNTYAQAATKRFSCTQDNLKEEIEDCAANQELCIGPFASDSILGNQGETACVPKSICDQCGQPFGTFARSADNVGQLYTEAAGAWFSCSIPQVQAVCFEDTSKLNVDIFKPVTPNTTCYDFTSKKACVGENPQPALRTNARNEEQRAYIYNGTNTQGFNCEWVEPFDTGETGFGVCRPLDPDLQDCSRCHDPQSKWFGKCNKDTCAYYGKCYYDEKNPQSKTGGRFNTDSNNFKEYDQYGLQGPYFACRPEREISCYDYDTEEDCIGSDSPYSYQGTAVIKANISRATQGQIEQLSFSNIAGFTGQTYIPYYNKTSGTNELLSRSDDYFNFGVCTWGVTQYSNGRPICYKNADADPATPEQATDDCSNIPQPGTFSPECERDFNAPNTTLVLPPKIPGTFTIEVGVDDLSTQLYGDSNKWPITYACITEKGNTCYPTSIAKRNLTKNIIDNDHITFNVEEQSWKDKDNRILKSGNYDIYYFSEDYSHNLEVVQHETVFIDSNPPEINAQFSNVSFEENPDEWFTNLNITLSASDPENDPQEVTCTAKLDLDGQEVQSANTLSAVYGTQWERFYTYLIDGLYTYTVTCEDDVGNKKTVVYNLTIEGDKSITNPLPRNTLTDNSVVLSVQTGKDAQCYYLESFEPLDDFEDTQNNNEELLSQMTPFENTGGTIHTQTYSQLSQSRWYRFYIRCLFPDEPEEHQVKGNKADEIRFAIDREHPVTILNTQPQPFNDWYNAPVRVELLCRDRPLFDYYLRPVEFGCAQTQYAVGFDNTAWNTYTTPFTLNKSTHLTFFSTDKGGNEEPLNYNIGGVDYDHENVPINIDTTPPELTLTITDGEEGNQVEFLRLGIVYKVTVTSNEELLPHYIQNPTAQLLVQSGSFPGLNVDVALERLDDNPQEMQGILFLTDNAANRGFEGNATFTVRVADLHNVTGEVQQNLFVDTRAPNTPILNPAIDIPLEPARSFYEQAGFPLRRHNNSYYTNDSRIQLTGYTDELLTVKLTHTIDGVDAPLSPYTFKQSPTTRIYQDSVGVLAGFNDKIQVEGDASSQISRGQFIGFGEFPPGSNEDQVGPRRSYKSFGQFYEITDVQVINDPAGAYTILRINPSLEQPLPGGSTINIYDRAVPSYYFAIEPFLEKYAWNDLVFTVSDNAGNIARFPSFPETIHLFYDPVPPKILSHLPLAGTTARDITPIEIVVSEETAGSGINLASAQLFINNISVNFTVTNVTDTSEGKTYYYFETETFVFPEGEYNVSFFVEDNAGNPLDQTLTSKDWTFIIDKSVPLLKEFRVLNATRGPENPPRWYTQDTNPTFVLDFSTEPNPVEITAIRFDHQISGDSVATCTQEEFNIFTCTFFEPPFRPQGTWPDYGLKVYARKTLDDGTQTKIYELPGANTSFEFTIDNEAPNIDLIIPRRVKDNEEVSFTAMINNENHQVNVELTPVQGLSKSGTIAITNYAGQTYNYLWTIPDLTKTQGDEGEKQLELIFSDLAGNTRTVTQNVFVDLTPPSIDISQINFTNVVTINDKLYTASANVSIKGNLLDEDIEQIYLKPGNFNGEDGTYEERQDATIRRIGGGKPSTFEVNVRVKGDLGEEVLNQYELFVRDEAGHISTYPVQITKDLKPPATPIICVDRDAGIC